MNTKSQNLWQTALPAQFSCVLSDISDVSTMQSFLRDIMTEKEIVEISARLEAAKLLRAGETYTDIVARTKLSSRTIARISDWLKNGSGGYTAALNLAAHHSHIPPARAE